jgi:hypothetical protein
VQPSHSSWYDTLRQDQQLVQSLAYPLQEEQLAGQLALPPQHDALSSQCLAQEDSYQQAQGQLV